MIGLSTNITTRQIASGGQPLQVSLTIDDGAGNVVAVLAEGGSVDVSVDNGPVVTIIDQPGNEDIGFVYAPSFSGELAVGSELTVDLGVVYFQGDGPITVEQDILRNGAVVAAGIRASSAPATYTYTVVQADVGQSVQVRSRLTNGGNMVELLTDLVTPQDMPVAAAGAQGWYDFGDAGTITVNNERISEVANKVDPANPLVQGVNSSRPWADAATINGRLAARFDNSSHLRFVSPVTVRAFALIVRNPTGAQLVGVAPILGSKYDAGVDQQYAFLRGDGSSQDFDMSLDGPGAAGSDSGTVWADTGATGTGENVRIGDLTLQERQDVRAYFVALDQDYSLVDVVGALRTSSVLTNGGTYFGELVTFPSELSVAQANAVMNHIAPKWSLSWNDIT